MAPTPEAQRRVNRWGSRIIPGILMGLVGFATWVVIVLIGVNYLIHPPTGVPKRQGAGIAIIVIYCVLFLLMSTTYLRVLHVVITNPGLVPIQEYNHKARRTRRKRRKGGAMESKDQPHQNGQAETPSQEVGYLDRGAVYGGRHLAPNGLEQYYNRDVFECELDGMPRWCSNCRTWKPDRSHHSSEINRCVYKMDHYCPWAGGIISETTYKFFVQFCTYGMFYCILVLVVTAYYTGDWHRRSNSYNVTWVILIALAGLFFLFSLGMAWNSLLAAYQNTTTVDNLTRQNRVYHFAVLMPQWHPLVQVEISRRATADANEAIRQSPPPEATTPYATITYPLLDPAAPSGSQLPQQTRVFAILPSPQGSNPYLLSSRLANIRATFGHYWYDWFLPIRYSPCCAHLGLPTGDGGEAGSNPSLMYELGPILDQMKRDAGLVTQGEKSVETDRYGRRRIRERPSSTQQQNG